jgi:hypothetical protein
MKLNYNTLSDIKGYAITTLITLVISVVFCVVYVNYNVSSLERRYVVVNTDAISRQFLSVIIRANLPDEKYKHLLISYDTKLSEVINKVSLQNNFVILKKGSVLTELPDITADIQSITFGELNLDELLNA